MRSMNLLASRLRVKITVSLGLALFILGGINASATQYTINLSGTNPNTFGVDPPTNNVGGTGQPNWLDVPAGTGGTGGTMYVGQINNKVTDATYNVITSMKYNGAMQGYNDASASVSTYNGGTSFSTQSGAGMTVSQLPTVTINSVTYYEVVIDFKIANAESSTGCVLDQLKIYAGNPGVSISSTTNLSSLGTKLFDLGNNSIKVSAIQNTSNISQLGIYIPTSDFVGISGTKAYYVWTDITGLTASNDQVNVAWDSADNGLSVTVAPEAHTVWGGLSIGLLLCGGYIRKRFVKAKAAC